MSGWAALLGAWVLASFTSACFTDFTTGGDSNCGNGVMETGEVCDGTDFGGQTCLSALGRAFGELGCTATCLLEVVGCHDCGNGAIDPDELCDDGNGVADDGCSDRCEVEEGWICVSHPSECEPICGDGLVRGPEQCDDGDTDAWDGCSDLCQPEPGWTCEGQPSQCERLCDPDCGPCDLDGDGFIRDDPAQGCILGPEEMADCDDFDSGVHPDITWQTDHNEGGEDSSHAIYEQQLCDGIDNDCDGDIDEGCWPHTCDQDQDGYQNASCNPVTGQEDCDDTNPNIYPGAPDICGDGVLQNCNTDTPCDSDGDSDGYNAPEDCDDANGDVHPGATEICNGVDDDCDGLVDEGNPDHLGAKMVYVYCNNDNDGICGDPFGQGRCVCTKGYPGAPLDENNRVACPGEDLGAVASPRCFFAPTPEPFEQCDSVDHDCNGEVDDPSGATLLELGDSCGTNNGECVAGTVLGCDFTQTTVGALNEHFLCSPEFVGPLPERCNGRDDDCDGVTPTDELDLDNDGYIACSNCGGENLVAGVIGCDDCAPSAYAVNPGHNDNCNLVDDDCDPSSPNGIDECGGATPDCCGGLYLCTDLQTDFAHCGGCTDSACDSMRANLCSNGTCRCGAGPTCNHGLECVGTGTAATCQCNSSSCPSGCCSGTTCVPFASQSDSTCGDNGVTCFSCTNERGCISGQCLCYGVVNPPNESSCDDALDNDCDGATDCTDTDCNGATCGPGLMCVSGNCL